VQGNLESRNCGGPVGFGWIRLDSGAGEAGSRAGTPRKAWGFAESHAGRLATPAGQGYVRRMDKGNKTLAAPGQAPTAAQLRAQLTDLESEVADTYLQGGFSMRAAVRAVIGGDTHDAMQKREGQLLVRRIRERVGPYVVQASQEAGERAGISRQALIEQAMLDREFAIEQENPAAAVAATKLAAQLSGYGGVQKADAVEGMQTAVQLLEAVERLARGDKPQPVIIDG